MALIGHDSADIHSIYVNVGEQAMLLANCQICEGAREEVSRNLLPLIFLTKTLDIGALSCNFYFSYFTSLPLNSFDSYLNIALRI